MMALVRTLHPAASTLDAGPPSRSLHLQIAGENRSGSSRAETHQALISAIKQRDVAKGEEIVSIQMQRGIDYFAPGEGGGTGESVVNVRSQVG